MAYDVKQIYQIVNDAAHDALGKNAGVTKLTTTDFVSLGKQLSDMGLLEGWFGALAKRITQTLYFVREYDPKRRSVLRDEQEWGAFIQKVYYKLPDANENTAWKDKPDGNGKYKQSSYFDVEDTIEVKAVVYGDKGTWSIDFVRPIVQIKNAFLGDAEMIRFIDGMYVTVENSMKKEIEAIESAAVNTGMALAISRGNATNLLNLYNMDHDNAVITVNDALKNPEFMRLASKELGDIIEQIQHMGVTYSPAGWETFTPKEKLVVEILGKYVSAAKVYLQADTFHKDLVALPNFEEVSFWQSQGNKNFAFEDVSKINIKNSALQVQDVYASDTVTQGGILAYIHDIEAVAASFYDRYSYEEINRKDRCVVHGDQATKGYAVDENANAWVYFIEDTNPITVSGDAEAVLKYTHAYAGVTNHITTAKTPTASGITFTSDGAGGYTFVMPSNAAITITCA